LKGTTVSVTLDGHVVLGFVYNALTVDGGYGLFTEGGASTFDTVTMMTDDPALSDGLPGLAPIAGDDAFTTDEDTPLVITAAQLLANDSDRDGTLLTIVEVMPPSHRALVDNKDGTWTYIPALNFFGTDTFTYTVRDADSRAATAVVTIEVRSVVDIYTYVSTSGGPIADNGTTRFTIQVGDAYFVGDLNVTLNINHPRVSDLAVFLISPKGTRIQLFAGIGGSGANFVNTVLDDEAVLSITSGSAPFTGMYRPVGSLAALKRQSVTGTWMLEVTDTKRPNAGTLVNWSLVIQDGIPNNPPVAGFDTLETAEDTPLTIAHAAVLANDSDVNGDLLTIVSFTLPSQGSLTSKGSDWIYTPAPNFHGADSFTYYYNATKAQENLCRRPMIP